MTLPRTLEEWQSFFTEQFLEDIPDDVTVPSYVRSTGSRASTLKAHGEPDKIPSSTTNIKVEATNVPDALHKQVQIKGETTDDSSIGSTGTEDSSVLYTGTRPPRTVVELQDYPTFTGTHDDWDRFKAEFQAIAGLST